MNPVRIGMIGCGGHARWHISNLCKVADARVVALADPNPAQIQRTQAMFPALAKVPAFSDFHAMLAQAELDAVVICTPHTQHVDQVIDAFGRGLHVLVEKPMVTSVEDAHRVLDAHRKAPGKVGAIGYQRHTQPEFIRLRQEIASGKWGAVTYLAALQCQEWKRLTKGTWRQDPQLSGGGQLNDSGSHLIDILLWVTGLRPASVSAVIDNLGTPVDINSSLSIRFAGGAMASVAIVGDAPCWHEEITVWCEKGMFLVRNGHLCVVEADATKSEFQRIAGGSDPDRNFVDAILGRAEVAAPLECGLRVIELTEAAWESGRNQGLPVRVHHED